MKHPVIHLTAQVVKTCTGPHHYIPEGFLFDAANYADIHNLNRFDMDNSDIKTIQDATGHLNPGEWLEVSHSLEWEPRESIEQKLREHFGDGNYTITQEGTIHVFGTMPNTSLDDWYVYGDIENPETIDRINSL